MSLSRLTNYVDGNVLTGAQLNNEFDNILNNGPALVSASIPSVSIVQGLTGSIISNIGSFQANGYQCKSTSTICSLSATSSYSINTQTAGPVAGGRDQAAVFASTNVHFYAITTGGTSTKAAGVCSTKPPTIGPTLPAGYSAWVYLASAPYSTASSATSGLGAGALVSGARVQIGGGGAVPFYSTGPCAYSSFSVSSVIPQVATQIHTLLRLQGTFSSNGGNLSLAQSVGADSVGTYEDVFDIFSVSTATTRPPSYDNWLRATYPNVNTPPALYLQNVVNTGTSGFISVYLLGYMVPNGDVG